MSLRIRKKFVVVNLVLIIVLFSCYLVSMFLLRYYTKLAWPGGQWGGAFTYVPFGMSTIYHLTSSGFEPVFYLPDTAPYVLAAIIVFNLLMLFSRKLSSSENKLYLAQTAVTVLSLPIYIYTMTFVEDALKWLHYYKDAAGAVFYYPFFVVGATQTNQGHLEGTETFLPDVPMWLFLFMLILAIITIRRLRREEQHAHEAEKT